MRAFREWTSRLPGSAQFVVLALVIAVIWFLFSAARGRPSVIAPLVIGVILSALITPVSIVRRRVLGALELMGQVSAAVRTGILPRGIDVDRWMLELDRRRRLGIQFAVVGLALLLAGAGFAVFSVLRPDVFEEQLAHILSAVLFGGLGISLLVSSVLQVLRVRRLRGVLVGAAALA